jgi:hypothetical protein
MTACTPWRDSVELNRMVFEKSAAVAAGAIGVQTEAVKIAARAVVGKRTKNVATAMAAAAIRPALRTVKGNAKRLGQKSRRRR